MTHANDPVLKTPLRYEADLKADEYGCIIDARGIAIADLCALEVGKADVHGPEIVRRCNGFDAILAKLEKLRQKCLENASQSTFGGTPEEGYRQAFDEVERDIAATLAEIGEME